MNFLIVDFFVDGAFWLLLAYFQLLSLVKGVQIFLLKNESYSKQLI
jgi:hypothetical protein